MATSLPPRKDNPSSAQTNEDISAHLPPGQDIHFLMIGKTGHGKSATGNSILGYKKFNSTASGASVTKQAQEGWKEIDGRAIKVVDTPGVYDTELADSGRKQGIEAMSQAIAKCCDGFHALLLVLSFGTRFTKEESKAIQMLKVILGKDIIKSSSILVFTRGDDYEEEQTIPFKEWCVQESKNFGKLPEECNYRCVLFNNRSKDPEVKKAQLNKLFAALGSMLCTSGYKHYTNELFQHAQKVRDEILSKKQISLKTRQEISLIHGKLNTLASDKANQTDKAFSELAERAETIKKKIEEIEDKEQRESLMEYVSSVIGSIKCSKEDFKERVRLANKKFEENVDTAQDQEKVASSTKEEVKKSCFPASSLVILSTGNSIALKDLQVGDMVLVRDGQGKLSYDQVYMFGHRDFQVLSEFIILETAVNSVAVTGEHYVYCVKGGKEQCIAANEVEVGDSLLLATDNGLVTHSVQKLYFKKMQGLFAPFTTSGTIIVDGALMSCYVNVLEAKTCHTLLWPMRQLYHLSPGALAFINGSSKGQAVPAWTKMAMKIATFKA